MLQILTGSILPRDRSVVGTSDEQTSCSGRAASEIVLVLGVVELTAPITEVREERFSASGAALELKGQAATIHSLILMENWFESGRDRDRLVDALSRRYAPVHIVAADHALPDLNHLRQLKVRLQKQGQDWLSVARTVAAEARIPRKDLRQLNRVIRGQLVEGSS